MGTTLGGGGGKFSSCANHSLECPTGPAWERLSEEENVSLKTLKLNKTVCFLTPGYGLKRSSFMLKLKRSLQSTYK